MLEAVLDGIDHRFRINFRQVPQNGEGIRNILRNSVDDLAHETREGCGAGQGIGQNAVKLAQNLKEYVENWPGRGESRPENGRVSITLRFLSRGVQ